MVYCVKLNKEAPGLDFPPFANDLGKKIHAQISQEAWRLWLSHQTLLINENRLSLADPKAREFLQREMEAFLFGQGSNTPAGFIEPSKASWLETLY